MSQHVSACLLSTLARVTHDLSRYNRQGRKANHDLSCHYISIFNLTRHLPKENMANIVRDVAARLSGGL